MSVKYGEASPFNYDQNKQVNVALRLPACAGKFYIVFSFLFKNEFIFIPCSRLGNFSIRRGYGPQTAMLRAKLRLLTIPKLFGRQSTTTLITTTISIRTEFISAAAPTADVETEWTGENAIFSFKRIRFDGFCLFYAYGSNPFPHIAFFGAFFNLDRLLPGWKRGYYLDCYRRRSLYGNVNSLGGVFRYKNRKTICWNRMGYIPLLRLLRNNITTFPHSRKFFVKNYFLLFTGT